MYCVQLAESYFPAQEDETVIETTVGSILRAQAAKTPDKEALVEALPDGALGRRWTYAALLGEAEALAGALLTRYRPGERICVWAPNTPEWVILEYAAAFAGLTLVTANPAYRPRELKFVIEQSRSAGLFIVKEHRGNPMAAIAAQVAAEVPALREIVDLDDWAALFAGADAAPALPVVAPCDAAQIQYTSGTTGFPKGALLHHRGLTNNARHGFTRMAATFGSTTINYMPMFHTSGCAMQVLGAAQFGCRMIVVRVFDPNVVLDLIEREQISVMPGVPTMLVALTEAQKARPRDVSCVRLAASGGSMVPPELIRQVVATFDCAFQTVYGQTEASPLLTQTRVDDPFEDVLDTVGQPVAQTEIAIRDPRTGAIVPIGEIGEICARGYGVMHGYNDNPEATAAAIDGGGWLRTGDLGTMDARGFLRITGRVKEMIIRGGENLFPAEIENVLLEHPTVLEVAVIGAPDPRWGEIVVCFVRLAPEAVLDPAALTAHCRERISPQKTPQHWVAVNDWPLTGSGKIQKFVLREQFVAGAFSPA